MRGVCLQEYNPLNAKDVYTRPDTLDSATELYTSSTRELLSVDWLFLFIFCGYNWRGLGIPETIREWYMTENFIIFVLESNMAAGVLCHRSMFFTRFWWKRNRISNRKEMKVYQKQW